MRSCKPPLWSLDCAQTILFRFSFLYFVLYAFPWPLSALPHADGLFHPYNRAWGLVVAVVAKHVFRLPQDFSHLSRGSQGDTTFFYLLQGCTVAIAGLGALLWLLLSRSRRHEGVLREGLQLYLRWYVAGQMFGYGLGKVINIQFPAPSLDRLMQPIGDSSPMGLLWVFMGSSPAYTFFAGALEVVGAALLMFRRTKLLAGLLLLGVLGNVVMLNFCYDVCVKLHSCHLFFMTLFLVAADLGRLTSFFLLDRPVPPPCPARLLEGPRYKRIRVVVTACVLAAQLGEPLVFIAGDNRRTANAHPPDLFGVYAVDEFASDDRAVPLRLEESKRWRRVVINQYGGGSIQRMGEPTLHFVIEPDTGKRTLTLYPYHSEDPGAPDNGYVLTYLQVTPDVLQVDGHIRGEHVRAKLRRQAPPDFLLLQRRFRFVNEYPFNR